MKDLKKARGSSAIPLTPFKEDGEVDFEVFEKEINWICEQKVGSICGPVNVSEFMVLDSDERKEFIRKLIDVTNGRVATIVNVASPNIKDAVKYTEFAQKCGADCVIAMPPFVGDLDFSSVKEYFRAISSATSLPVMIQNQRFNNISISEKMVEELCMLAPNISWVKQEVAPAPLSIERLTALKSPHIEGVMSGFSGLYSFQDHANGAVGTIHACEYCDFIQRLWDLMDEGKMQEARDLFGALAPALTLEGIYGWQYTKYIMQKRGIFKNRITRNLTSHLSSESLRDIDAVWENLAKKL
jgi:4-hydroxy-tetrahydrodipicolinate synthase